MKHKSLHFIGIVLVSFFSACKKNDPGPVNPPPVAAATIIDYPYGPDAKMKMDVYLPAGRSSSSTKTLVIVHGGGWTAGDKADLNPYIDSFKKVLPNWALININYPLIDIVTGAHRHPAQITYIRRAMDTVKKNLASWNISNKFGMWGASAGGHLVLMHAYTQNTDGLVKAVCSFMGPTDLRDCWVNPPGPDTRAVVINYTGILIPNLFGQDYYDWGSPVYMMPNNAPPTIAFHGASDILVSVTQSRKLRDKLVAKGITHQYFEYPGLGHDLWPADKLNDMLTKMGSFMQANVE
jgi:acetyl esterase/lipase